MAFTLSFPLPQRNPNFLAVHDVIFVDGMPVNGPEYEAMYHRSRDEHARIFRFQYLAVEEELERAFRYVSPCDV